MAQGKGLGRWSPALRLAAACGLLAALLVASTALAQSKTITATISRIAGQVEVLQGGHGQWAAARLGQPLVERDEVRALSGASADVSLSDGSTVLLAENSRFVLTKLEYDTQNQTRNVFLHLAVGKLRAVIAKTAIMLVRARQSNFSISTPTAVAAARGTTLVVLTDGSTAFMAVRDGNACCIDQASLIGIPFVDGTYTRQGRGQFCDLPLAINTLPAAQLRTLFVSVNPQTLNAPGLFQPATPPDPTIFESIDCSQPAASLRPGILPRGQGFGPTEPRVSPISPILPP